MLFFIQSYVLFPVRFESLWGDHEQKLHARSVCVEPSMQQVS